MPSAEERLQTKFEAWKSAREGGGSNDDEDRNNNCCNQLSFCVVFIIKIIVLAAASQVLFDSCSIGYMYDYILKTVILTGVLLGIACAAQICLIGSVAADNMHIFGATLCFISLAGFSCAIAYIVFIAEIYDQHPEDTIMFFASFYTNPIFPTNCTQGQDLTNVELGMGVVKYDTFVFMLGLVISAFTCATTCFCALCGASLAGLSEEEEVRREARRAPIIKTV